MRPTILEDKMQPLSAYNECGTKGGRMTTRAENIKWMKGLHYSGNYRQRLQPLPVLCVKGLR